MTSNMTMTAISICNFLKLIVKSTVEHYTEDFKLDIKIFKRYAKEAQETGKPVSMLWFCRSCGTYLCPEEDAYKKDTPMFITFKYYDEQEEEEAPSYYKTAFSVYAVIDGEEYSFRGRYDIGSEGKSLLEHIREYYAFPQTACTESIGQKMVCLRKR